MNDFIKISFRILKVLQKIIFYDHFSFTGRKRNKIYICIYHYLSGLFSPGKKESEIFL